MNRIRLFVIAQYVDVRTGYAGAASPPLSPVDLSKGAVLPPATSGCWKPVEGAKPKN